ncbi:MAG: C13 family peptidase [Syntrophobacteraceae bacterium]
MGKIRKLRVFTVVGCFMLTVLLFFPASGPAQIDSLRFAYDKLVADVFSGHATGKEVLGNSEMVQGPVKIETTREVLDLGEGSGWVFFIAGDSTRSYNEVVFVSTTGRVVRKSTKGKPVSLSEYVPVSGTNANLLSSTPVASAEEAYSRLVDRLLGHTVGERRIYLYNEKVQGLVTIENWRKTLTLGQGPGWLFFIDDIPRANWEHDCRFVLVTEAGELLVTGSTTPPKSMAGFAEITPAGASSEGKAYVQNGKTPPSPQISSVLGAPNTPAANRWAVIISGGYNQYNNHIRYWNDCSYFYKTLKANGFSDDHIIVLFADGTDPAVDRSDGTNSPLDLDEDGDDDIQYSATKANITTVFNNLQTQLGSEDILYIFTTDHGGSNDSPPYDNPNSILWLWEEGINDSEFAVQVDKVTTKATVCIFEQCFSGGMIDDLKKANRVLMSASRFWELSFAMGDSFYNDDYQYDEFSYYATYALANPSASDANGDGTVSMEEAYLYALSNDSVQAETISGGYNNGEHPSYYSNPWDLGRKISLGGYSSVVNPPILLGYAQREITESYPTGGVNKEWYGDDNYYPYELPFTFPFAGQNHSQVYVSTNGMIYLENPTTNNYDNTVNLLKASKAIAPMWDDLTVSSTVSDAIYVTESSDWVTIRWQAHTKKDAIPRPVNFCAKLSSSGKIQFLYGEGNDHTSLVKGRDKTIGISKADNSNYHLCLRNGGDNLGSAKGIEYLLESQWTDSSAMAPILDLLLLQ